MLESEINKVMLKSEIFRIIKMVPVASSQYIFFIFKQVLLKAKTTRVLFLLLNMEHENNIHDIRGYIIYVKILFCA